MMRAGPNTLRALEMGPKVNTSIDGKIVSGLNGAHTALAFQLPHLISRFHVLAGCHPGTINVELDQPLRIQNPDFESPPIIWLPGHPPEKFAFLEITLEIPIGSSGRKAWIYVPSNSPHFHNVYRVEVIAPFIAAGTTQGTRCRVQTPKQHRIEPLIII
jgi:CTP-dependent riboflavin kinase